MLIPILQFLSDFSVEHPLWTSIFAVLITAYISKWFKSTRYRLPPGPMGLPIVGYLPFLSNKMHEDLTRLQQTYGGVFSLKLGSRFAVVLSDFKALKEVNSKDEAASRPPGFFTLSDNVDHLGDMTLKDWKESRRFTLSTLRTLGLGKNKVEDVIVENIARLLDQFDASTGKSEINLHSYLHKPITNTIIHLVCGKTVSMNSNFHSTVDTFGHVLLDYWEATTIGFYMPILRPIFNLINPKIKQMKQELDKMTDAMWTEIENHEKEFDESNQEDFMDHFIAEMKKNKTEHSTFTRKILNGNSQLLLLGGSDTTLTTVEWVFLYMAKHLDVQDRVYSEISQVLGKEKPPSWNDKENLPYLDAVILEVSRIRTIAPLTDPKWTTADIKVNNYDIPKDTYIINNIYGIHMDPNVWDNPQEFIPERFLTEDGTKTKNVEYLIPFGYGKHLCPGMKLGNVTVFLFVASVLQKFRILPPSSGLNMEEIVTGVVYPTSPFVKVEKRE